MNAIVTRCEHGELSAPMATMHLLLASETPAELDAALGALPRPSPELSAIRCLLKRHAEGCTTVTAMHRAAGELEGLAPSPEIGIAQARHLFDQWSQESEEASVAWYSLGSPDLLARATGEVVDVLERWGVLDDSRVALEIGCGVGRLLLALAPRLARVVGIDVAEGMLRAAERRTQHLDNVRSRLTSGRNLADFDAASFDLVYGVDAFPYIVRGGPELVEGHFRDVARLLRPGGDFVIFNYAYGRSRAEDAADVLAHAVRSGLSVRRSDETPFRIWDAVGFHLQKLVEP